MVVKDKLVECLEDEEKTVIFLSFSEVLVTQELNSKPVKSYGPG